MYCVCCIWPVWWKNWLKTLTDWIYQSIVYIVISADRDDRDRDRSNNMKPWNGNMIFFLFNCSIISIPTSWHQTLTQHKFDVNGIIIVWCLMMIIIIIIKNQKMRRQTKGWMCTRGDTPTIIANLFLWWWEMYTFCHKLYFVAHFALLFFLKYISCYLWLEPMKSKVPSIWIVVVEYLI